MNTNPLPGRRRLALPAVWILRTATLAFLGAGLTEGQVTLPAAPDGFQWKSQGVSVYTDSDSFSAELNVSTNSNTPATTGLSPHVLELTNFDAAPSSGSEFIFVHSSTYAVSVTGSASTILFNFDPTSNDFFGSVSLSAWEVSGGGNAGPVTVTEVRGAGSPLTLAPGTPALFSDEGSGATTIFQDLRDGGVAATDGALATFNVNLQLDVDIDGTSSSPAVFATGSAFGDATVQTVYETFTLVAIPEPGVPLLAGFGLLIASCRRRRL